MSGYSPPAVSCRIPATLEPAAMTVRVVHSANEHEGTPIYSESPGSAGASGFAASSGASPLFFLRRLFVRRWSHRRWLLFFRLRLRIARICFLRSCVFCPCLLGRIGRRRCGRGGRPGVVPQWRRRYRSWRLSGRECRSLCHRRKRQYRDSGGSLSQRCVDYSRGGGSQRDCKRSASN